MKKAIYWGAPAAMLTLLAIAVGVPISPATAEPTSSEAGSHIQIAQAVVQPSEVACRRIRPEALTGRLTVWPTPNSGTATVPATYVSAGDTVFIDSNEIIRGADSMNYVRINQPYQGYIRAELNNVDTLGYCSPRAGQAIRALW